MTNAIPTESAEQIAFVSWFESTFPTVLIFAIPNGGFRHKATAARLKAEGLRKGVPDLYVPKWRLWIEMKRTKGGSLSADQKNWRDYLIGIGDAWMCAKGAKDAISQVNKFLDVA